MNYKKKKKFFLQLNIQISEGENNKYYNPNKIKSKYTMFINQNSYLFLNNDNKLIISDQQGKIKENEKNIFYIELNEGNVQLKYPLYKGSYKFKEKFVDSINDYLNSQLYKLILNSKNENIFNDINKKMNYNHNLKINDVIRIDNFKLILKEFHINNNKENNNSKNQTITAKLEFDLDDDKDNICKICDEGDLGPEDPLIRFCRCEEYIHINCKKKEIIQTEEEIYKDCFRYNIKNIKACEKCKGSIPLTFIYNNKLYELFDIPKKNLNEDFLLFESLDYKNDKDESMRNIFYIRINEEKENILIGGENKEGNKNYTNKFDKLIKIDYNTIPYEQALIECDKLNKILKIKNINETHNFSILQENILIKPNNDEIYINVDNVKVEAKLIKKEEFEEFIKKWKDNFEKIEERGVAKDTNYYYKYFSN